MKQLSLILVLVVGTLFVSCDSSNSGGASIDGEYPPVPAGALKEAYPDKPDLVRVTISNSASQVTEQGDYYLGMRDGSWTEFHSNGYPKKVTSYVNGKKHGVWLSFSDRGQLEEKGYYFDDVQHGKYIKYNRTRIKEEMTFQLGNLEGVKKVYYNNGTIMEESMFEGGNLNGISKWYDQDGALKFEYEYKDNQLVNNQ